MMAPGTSTHEAAHAVATYLVGIRIGEVVLHSVRTGGGYVKQLYTRADLADGTAVDKGRTAMHLLMIYSAGHMAERVWYNRRGLPVPAGTGTTSPDDLEAIEELYTAFQPESRQWVRDLMERKVYTMLWNNWQAVEHLAYELRLHRRLNGRRATAILEAAGVVAGSSRVRDREPTPTVQA